MKRLTLMSAVVVPLMGLTVTPATGMKATDAVELQTYLSSASWTVRASTLRVNFVASTINNWVAYGDPPFLGQIAAGCANVQALDASSRLRKANVPAALQARHAGLRRAYATVRSHCREARQIARKTRDSELRLWLTKPAGYELTMRKIDTAARKNLTKFARNSLSPHKQATAKWRSAVLQYAATLGATPPAWMGQRGSQTRECCDKP